MGARDTAASTPDTTPEILRSRQLAGILTPILWEMATEAATRFEGQGLARYMREPLAAIRAMVNDIRRAHGLPAIDPRTGEPIGTASNGQAPAEAEPAEAEVKS
jgi:hypothetical protein